MSILDYRGGGWRSIPSTNDVGIVGGPLEIFKRLRVPRLEKVGNHCINEFHSVSH